MTTTENAKVTYDALAKETCTRKKNKASVPSLGYELCHCQPL